MIEKSYRHLRSTSVVNAREDNFLHLILHYVFVQGCAPLMSGHLNWVPTAQGRCAAKVKIGQLSNVHLMKERGGEDVDAF
jgi:hypothetical protein